LKSPKTFWRINNEIIARELRVIGSDGKQVGVLSKEDALKKAEEEGLDLVEVASSAKPPVAKIVEFGKFRYKEEKKLKKEFKKNKGGELKEIRLSPFIAENDYNTRLSRIKEFLADRNKVRVVVVFTGRQMNSRPYGYDVLKHVVADLKDQISVDMEPKFLGRHLAMVISPKTNTKAKEQQQKEDAKNQNS
jgi:translation initiation factor IF-3